VFKSFESTFSDISDSLSELDHVANLHLVRVVHDVLVMLQRPVELIPSEYPVVSGLMLRLVEG